MLLRAADQLVVAVAQWYIKSLLDRKTFAIVNYLPSLNMKSSNRDLLVLSKNESIDQREMDLVIEKLNQLLFNVESIENFCAVNEVIDINNYKIITSSVKIERIIRNNKLKRFQFIYNKN